MDKFSKLIVRSNSLGNIAIIHDLYLDSFCVERNLYSLNKQESHYAINNSGFTEQVMENYLEETAYGVFSVCRYLSSCHVRCIEGIWSGQSCRVSMSLIRCIVGVWSDQSCRVSMSLMPRWLRCMDKPGHHSYISIIWQDKMNMYMNRLYSIS